MRGILLLLLLASSAINSFAQIGITDFTPERRKAAETEMKRKFLNTTSFRTKQFVDLNAVHAEFLKRFEEAPGFGEDRPDGPEFQRPVGNLTLSGVTYTVVPPQLIGLENHQVVYLPFNERTLRKADFTSPETRKQLRTLPLTTFHASAVALLKAGTNLVTKVQPARAFADGALQPEKLLMVAPIHAKADCASCHKCEEGKLLGAFAYAFTRIDGPTNSIQQPIPLPQLAPKPIAWIENHTNTVEHLAIAAMPGR